METNRRDKIFEMAYFTFANPKMKEPVTGKETLGELYVDSPDYNLLKQHCCKLSEHLPEFIIIMSIMFNVLVFMFHFGDKTSVDKIADNNKRLIEKMKDDNILDEFNKNKWIKKTEEHIKILPQRTDEYYALYTYFCENIISQLYLEPLGIFRIKS